MPKVRGHIFILGRNVSVSRLPVMVSDESKKVFKNLWGGSGFRTRKKRQGTFLVCKSHYVVQSVQSSLLCIDGYINFRMVV